MGVFGPQTAPRPRRYFSLLAALIALITALSVVTSADARRRHFAPNTTITSGPAAGSTISEPSPTFTFSSSASNSTFQCKLDSGTFASCSTPDTTPSLVDGSHTLSVRAIDSLGYVDESPASRSFTVSTSSDASGGSGSGSIPTSWRRFASFENDLNFGTDFGWRLDSPMTVTRTSEAGGTFGNYAAKIVTNGGNSNCSCTRMTFQDGFSYGPGADIWMGGSWYVTAADKLSWSRLMNLGHFEASGDPDNWYLALSSRDPGQMEVVARNYNTDTGQSVVMDPRPIPQGRWFSIDIHAKLSPTDGQALTEVYLDGNLVSHSTKRNMWSDRPLTFYNAGLSYFYPGNGNTTVYFDGPRLTP